MAGFFIATPSPAQQRGTLHAVTSDQCFKTLVSPDTFKRWLYGAIQDLGDPAVTELVLDWLDPFITRVERDRIVAWHLGVSL